MNSFSEEQLNRVNNLVKEIEKLSDVEKLFLYLQLPCGRVEASEGKSKFNNGHGSSKSNTDLFPKKPDQETTQTYTWILSHLEVDPNVSLPKQEVYDEYRAFCQANRFEPLCVADFGKAMKHAFPCIKPRRLGQRGNSRYCYSGLRKRYKIQPPILPDLIEPTFCLDNDCSQVYNQIIENCRDYPDDCPLIEQTTPCYDGLAAINLKIDPHQVNNNNHNNTDNNNSYSNGVNNNNNNNNQTSTELDDVSAAVTSAAPAPSSLQLPVDQQQQQQFVSAAVAAAAVASVSQQQPLLSSSSSSSSQTIPLQASGPRYGYGGVIPQPGTPDDDDYRHNYQDFNIHPSSATTFKNHQIFSAIATTSAGEPPSFPTTPISAGTVVGGPRSVDSYVSYQQPVTTSINHNLKISNQQLKHPPTGEHQHELGQSRMLRLDGSDQPQLLTHTNNNIQQHINNNVQQVIQHQQQHHHHQHLNQHQNHNNIHPQQHLINHMMINSSHFESSCASPFQSPASTPYPSMMSTNHHHPHHSHHHLVSNDQQQQPNATPTTSAASNFQDYYPNSDFIRYSN